MLDKEQAVKIFKDAVHLIENQEEFFGCSAIEKACIKCIKDDLLIIILVYQDIFAEWFNPKPQDRDPVYGWFGIPSNSSQNERIFALLFMIEIIETEY